MSSEHIAADDLRMRKANLGDMEELVEFGEDCFGKPYIFMDEMKRFLEDDNNRIYVIEKDGRIIAASMLLKDDKAGIMEDMDVSADDFDRISEGKPVLHNKFCMVRDDLRGMGIMSKMLVDIFNELEKEGIYGAIFGQAWIKNGEIPMETICRNTGYIPYKRQISPWYKFTDRICCVCGGRCRCDALVYYRKL